MPTASSLEVRDRGIIIRINRLSDTSQIVEWLTEASGRVATVARGALRKKSAFSGKLDLLFESSISFRRSLRSDLHQLREVSLLRTPNQLRRSIARLNQIAYFIELIRRTTETDTPIPEIYHLMHESLTAAEAAHQGAHFVLWFEWQLLGILGLQPTPESTHFTRPTIELLERWSTHPSPSQEPIAIPESLSDVATHLGQAWLNEIGKVPKLRGTLLTSAITS